jgi:amino-acid N-acetyltransferase
MKLKDLMPTVKFGNIVSPQNHAMVLSCKLIEDQTNFEIFCAQLKASGLPYQDLDFQRDLLVGYYESDELVGTGGLEVHGQYALLRSLSVKLGIRGQSVGTTITNFLIDEAKSKKLRAIFLLTETAREFFLKKGFQELPRQDVPEDIKQSSEFSNVCPTSATVMRLVI